MGNDTTTKGGALVLMHCKLQGPSVALTLQISGSPPGILCSVYEVWGGREVGAGRGVRRQGHGSSERGREQGREGGREGR